MQKPLITVIMPTYQRNYEAERAVVSAISQTYENMEIIIVDDNAKNPSFREAIKEIAQKYPKIKLIKNKRNLGGALSRNVGIKQANGELIAFLDDDDEWLPDKLEKQYDIYKINKENNLGLVYSNDHGVDFSKNLVYQHMLRIIASTSAWLIPKKVLLDIGCFDDVPSEQDTTLLFKLLKAGYKIFAVPEDLVIWHKHNSASGISGVKPKNIIGTEALRELYRKNYNLLDDGKQISDVEYALSAKLLPKYIYNKRKTDAKRELKQMIATKPLDKRTIKGIVKYIFPKLVKARGN